MFGLKDILIVRKSCLIWTVAEQLNVNRIHSNCRHYDLIAYPQEKGLMQIQTQHQGQQFQSFMQGTWCNLFIALKHYALREILSKNVLISIGFNTIGRERGCAWGQERGMHGERNLQERKSNLRRRREVRFRRWHLPKESSGCWGGWLIVGERHLVDLRKGQKFSVK